LKENSALQDKRSAKPVQAPAAVEEAVKPVEKQNVPAPVEAVQVQPQAEKPAPTPTPAAVETPAIQVEEKKAPAETVEEIIEQQFELCRPLNLSPTPQNSVLVLAEPAACARTEATENREPQDLLCRRHMYLQSLLLLKTSVRCSWFVSTRGICSSA